MASPGTNSTHNSDGELNNHIPRHQECEWHKSNVISQLGDVVENLKVKAQCLEEMPDNAPNRDKFMNIWAILKDIESQKKQLTSMAEKMGARVEAFDRVVELYEKLVISQEAIVEKDKANTQKEDVENRVSNMLHEFATTKTGGTEAGSVLNTLRDMLKSVEEEKRRFDVELPAKLTEHCQQHCHIHRQEIEADKEAEIQGLRSQLEQLRNGSQQTTSAIDSIKSTLSDAFKSFTKTDDRSQRLEDEKLSLQSDLNAARLSLEAVCKERDSIQNELTTIATERYTAVAALADLKGKHALLDCQNGFKLEQLGDAANKVTTLSKQVEDKRDEMVTLRVDIIAKDDKLKQQQALVTDLQNQITTAGQELVTARNCSQTFQSHLTIKIKELTATQDTNMMLHAENEENTKLLKSRQEQITHLQTEKVINLALVEQLKADNNAYSALTISDKGKIATLRADNNNITGERDKFKGMLVDLSNEVGSYLQRAGNGLDRVKPTDVQRSRQTRQYNTVEEQVLDLRYQMQDFALQLNSVYDKIADLETQNTVHVADVTKANELLEGANKACKLATERKDHFKLEFTTLATEHENCATLSQQLNDFNKSFETRATTSNTDLQKVISNNTETVTNLVNDIREIKTIVSTIGKVPAKMPPPQPQPRQPIPNTQQSNRDYYDDRFTQPRERMPEYPDYTQSRERTRMDYTATPRPNQPGYRNTSTAETPRQRLSGSAVPQTPNTTPYESPNSHQSRSISPELRSEFRKRSYSLFRNDNILGTPSTSSKIMDSSTAQKVLKLIELPVYWEKETLDQFRHEFYTVCGTKDYTDLIEIISEIQKRPDVFKTCFLQKMITKVTPKNRSARVSVSSDASHLREKCKAHGQGAKGFCLWIEACQHIDITGEDEDSRAKRWVLFERTAGDSTHQNDTSSNHEAI